MLGNEGPVPVFYLNSIAWSTLTGMHTIWSCWRSHRQGPSPISHTQQILLGIIQWHIALRDSCNALRMPLELTSIFALSHSENSAIKPWRLRELASVYFHGVAPDLSYRPETLAYRRTTSQPPMPRMRRSQITTSMSATPRLALESARAKIRSLTGVRLESAMDRRLADHQDPAQRTSMMTTSGAAASLRVKPRQSRSRSFRDGLVSRGM